MIETKENIKICKLTPDTLRSEARNVRYTSRALPMTDLLHAAQVMEWAAEHITELEARLNALETWAFQFPEDFKKRTAYPLEQK